MTHARRRSHHGFAVLGGVSPDPIAPPAAVVVRDASHQPAPTSKSLAMQRIHGPRLRALSLPLLVLIATNGVAAGGVPPLQSGRGELAASELRADYAGAHADLLEQGLAEPLSLTTADFDEDGTPDLVVGYGYGERGLIALYRGEVRAIHPGAQSAPASPFHRVALVLPTTQRPDYLGSGDFDADGHFDVAIGTEGRATLELLRGGGSTRPIERESIALDGFLSAMAVGEVNRRDGLADLVVAVEGRSGPRLLVFESPEGAVRAEPERIELVQSVRSIELGSVDGDSFRDITLITDGGERLIRGRNRRLTSIAALPSSAGRARPQADSPLVEEAAPRVSRLAHGATSGAPRSMLAMRLDRDALPDFVLIREESATPLLLRSLTSATFTVDSTGDDSDFSTADGVCDTDDSAGDGPCTLRAAIQQANASSGADAIEFAITGPAPHTIQPQSALPVVTEAVTMDGTTEPDFAGAPVIELDGTAAGTNADGLRFTASNCVLRGLVVNRFDGDGIEISGSSNLIEGNYIGTDVSGTQLAGNRRNGIAVWSGSDNIVGGTTAAARNVVSGNDTPGLSIGVSMVGGGITGTIVQGNYIGTDASGTTALPNYLGIAITSASTTTVGGTTPGAGNLVSGNSVNGVSVGGPDALLAGNLIGTDVTGTQALGNGGWGVSVGAVGALIGGTSPQHRNVIAASGQDGFSVGTAAATGIRIEGNYIGVASDGLTPLGNARHGLRFGNSGNDNTVGGTAGGAANVIAHNVRDGVLVHPNDVRIAILGNAIFANGEEGIDLDTGFFTYGDGVTANDAGDLDTGANNLQNYPVLTGIADGGSTVAGTINSNAGTELRIEFFASASCDASGHGEGETYLGADLVTTDGAGDALFSSSLTTPAPIGRHLTATATDPDGNTSEFSACLQFTATADLGITKDDGFTEVAPGGQVTYTIVATNAGPDDIPGARVDDELPEALTCTWACISSGGATCTPGPVAGDIEDTLDLPVGGSATYTLICDVSPTAAGSLENAAEVIAPDGVIDPDPDNNWASDVDALLELDYGDAPDPTFPTLWASDGARHFLGSGLFLGAMVDGDADGQPGAGADGDDADGSDDEDGVAFTTVAMTGYTATLAVTASAAGLLNAWIDFDGDGTWLGAGEQIFTDLAVAPGVQMLGLSVPATAALGVAYSRFRLDSAGGLSPDGPALDGEVEDHAVEIRYSALDVAETGQTTSYAAGDDGGFQAGVSWPTPRFLDQGDGTMTDGLTGLMWTQDNVSPGPAPCNPNVTRSWFDSLAMVACLNANSYLGYADWRMPNILELNSLVHLGVADQRPWWQSQGFTLASTYRWWSSTTVADGLTLAHTVSAFGTTSGFSKGAITGTALWPVRGGPGGGEVQLATTGQVRCWSASYSEIPCAGTGQDGEHQAGTAWPSPASRSQATASPTG